jgi:hypothetical protein
VGCQEADDLSWMCLVVLSWMQDRFSNLGEVLVYVEDLSVPLSVSAAFEVKHAVGSRVMVWRAKKG